MRRDLLKYSCCASVAEGASPQRGQGKSHNLDPEDDVYEIFLIDRPRLLETISEMKMAKVLSAEDFILLPVTDIRCLES